MNDTCKRSFLLDQRLLEKYGSVLDVEPDVLLKTYNDFTNKQKSGEKDKLLKDPNQDQYSNLFDDCSALFKVLTGQNRKGTKEANFLALFIDLLHDRKVSMILSNNLTLK